VPERFSCCVFVKDISGAVNAHKDGYKVMSEYSSTGAITENKELFVRIVVACLIDHSGGSL
jgi:hypothetical protein